MCVSVSVQACVRACVCEISRKPWLVRVRVRVTQGLSLSNSPGVIEANVLSTSILLGQHKGCLNPIQAHMRVTAAALCCVFLNFEEEPVIPERNAFFSTTAFPQQIEAE